MTRTTKQSFITGVCAFLGGVYFVTGCAALKAPPATPKPKQPYIVQTDATGLWKWQYVASNNFLVVESLDEYDSPQDALSNYHSAREAFIAHPDPRIEREEKL